MMLLRDKIYVALVSDHDFDDSDDGDDILYQRHLKGHCLVLEVTPHHTLGLFDFLTGFTDCWNHRGKYIF